MDCSFCLGGKRLLRTLCQTVEIVIHSENKPFWARSKHTKFCTTEEIFWGHKFFCGPEQILYWGQMDWVLFVMQVIDAILSIILLIAAVFWTVVWIIGSLFYGSDRTGE